MADLSLIRAGLAANLAALTDIQVSGYMLANPTPPCVHLYPADIEYDLAYHRGLDKWTFTVQVFVGLTSDIGAQVRLDTYLAAAGAQSIKAAIETKVAGENTVTLGGVVSDVSVVSCSGYRVYAREGAGPVLGAEFTVEVLATGT